MACGKLDALNFARLACCPCWHSSCIAGPSCISPDAQAADAGNGHSNFSRRGCQAGTPTQTNAAPASWLHCLYPKP